MTKSSSPSRLDAFFGNPAAAVGMAVVCNVLWGSAFPFIKMGYRLFAIDATDTASIMCFAGVRFMLSALLVYAGGAALRRAARKRFLVGTRGDLDVDRGEHREHVGLKERH